MSALIDTSVLVDYLTGDARAARVLEEHPRAAISVIAWLEVMAISPADRVEQTRAYLRSFERLSISEAIADEALRLLQQHRRLGSLRALSWATAVANQLTYVTVDAAGLPEDARILVPYRGTSARTR
jgi:predicted nucleic acid-binding protein